MLTYIRLSLSSPSSSDIFSNLTTIEIPVLLSWIPASKEFFLTEKTVKTEYVHFSRQMILALLAIIFYNISFPDCASESGSKVAWRNSLLWQQQHFEFLNALRAGFYTSVSLLLKNQTNSSAAGKKRANFKVKAICLPRSLIINSLWSSRTTSGHFFLFRIKAFLLLLHSKKNDVWCTFVMSPPCRALQ